MEIKTFTFHLINVLIFVTSPSHCAKILSIPFPLYSHIQTMTWLRDDLQKYGHDLWVTFPNVLSSRGVMEDKSFNFITYDSLDDRDPEEYWIKPVVNYYLDPDNFKSVMEGNRFFQTVDRILRYVDPTHIPTEAFRGAAFINDIILRDTKLLETIRSHNFDLVLVDSTVGMPYAIIPYKLDIPFCFIGPFFDSWRAGAPTYPSFAPLIGLGTSDRMSFKDRLKSTVQHAVLMAANPLCSESLMSEYAPEKPYMSMTTLSGKAQLWLIEQSTVIDFPRSAMPNTKFIGGLSVVDSKPLEGQFKTFYEQSKHGVVVVSFGGSLKCLPKHLSDKLQQAFSLTPYQYVWRSNITYADTQNYLTSDWIPQNDLLGHPKTKLLVTHCGAYSQFESLYHGVPMIGLPVYAEQHYNSRRMAVKRYGIAMDFHQNTAEDLAEAIITVIETPEYKENIVKASKIFKDKPLTPRQEAAYWLDHVIKYGGNHFRSAGLDLPWYQFMCFDVLLLLFLIMCLCLYISSKCTLCLIGYICKRQKTKLD